MKAGRSGHERQNAPAAPSVSHRHGLCEPPRVLCRAPCFSTEWQGATLSSKVKMGFTMYLDLRYEGGAVVKHSSCVCIADS